MRRDSRDGKEGTSGMDKFGNVIDRMNTMKLESIFLPLFENQDPAP
jgi:hypothetical protein